MHFVNLGAASVTVTARTAAKCEATKASLEERTKTEGKNIIRAMELDMSSLETTKKFVDNVKQELETIDYVILNAGLFPTVFKKLDSGWEETLQVNVLSTALLAILLLPWMKTAGRGQSHLVFVTSGLHTTINVEEPFPQTDILEYFNKPENFRDGGSGMYGISKLLETYVVNEIVKLAKGPDGRSVALECNDSVPGYPLSFHLCPQNFSQTLTYNHPGLK